MSSPVEIWVSDRLSVLINIKTLSVSLWKTERIRISLIAALEGSEIVKICSFCCLLVDIMGVIYNFKTVCDYLKL